MGSAPLILKLAAALLGSVASLSCELLVSSTGSGWFMKSINSVSSSSIGSGTVTSGTELGVQVIPSILGSRLDVGTVSISGTKFAVLVSVIEPGVELAVSGTEFVVSGMESGISGMDFVVSNMEFAELESSIGNNCGFVSSDVDDGGNEVSSFRAGETGLSDCVSGTAFGMEVAELESSRGCGFVSFGVDNGGNKASSLTAVVTISSDDERILTGLYTYI